MAAAAQAQSWNGPSRRRVPRFPLRAPVDVTVLRSGIPDTMPGRSVNLCESGIAAMLAGELVPGETAGVEVHLPLLASPMRVRATVRHQDQLRSGLEFMGLSAAHRAAIRAWSMEASAEADGAVSAEPVLEGSSQEPAGGDAVREAVSGPPGKKRRRWGWAAFLFLLLVAAVFWWRWNQSWKELESGLKSEGAASIEKPQVQVPAQEMERLLLHRVEPAYPAEARQANLQGIIILDVIVGRDGSVKNVRALNGPDVLARAAADTLRWWKFEPYRVNGEPVAVETTMAVEFKP